MIHYRHYLPLLALSGFGMHKSNFCRIDLSLQTTVGNIWMRPIRGSELTYTCFSKTSDILTANLYIKDFIKVYWDVVPTLFFIAGGNVPGTFPLINASGEFIERRVQNLVFTMFDRVDLYLQENLVFTIGTRSLKSIRDGYDEDSPESHPKAYSAFSYVLNGGISRNSRIYIESTRLATFLAKALFTVSSYLADRISGKQGSNSTFLSSLLLEEFKEFMDLDKRGMIKVLSENLLDLNIRIELYELLC